MSTITGRKVRADAKLEQPDEAQREQLHCLLAETWAYFEVFRLNRAEFGISLGPPCLHQGFVDATFIPATSGAGEAPEAAIFVRELQDIPRFPRYFEVIRTETEAELTLWGFDVRTDRPPVAEKGSTLTGVSLRIGPRVRLRKPRKRR